MTIRPEDHGGTTDPLAPLANLSTVPGRSAGKAIDPTHPSAADLIPTQPESTADRIAWLEREIAAWHRNIGRFSVSTQEERDEFLRLDAELSRLRNEQMVAPGASPTDPCPRCGGYFDQPLPHECNPRLSNEQPELNSRGEPMDAATIARGRKPADAENAPLRSEKPKGGERPPTEHEMALVRMYETDIPFDPLDEAAPSPATSPGPQDVRTRIADIARDNYYDHAPLVDTRTIWEHIADGVLFAFPALAQSDAQPVGWTRHDAVREALEKAVNKAIGMLVAETSDEAVLVGVEGVEPEDVIETYETLSSALALAKASPAGKSAPDGWLIIGGASPDYTTKKDLAEAYERKGYEIRAFFYTTPPALPEGAREALEAAAQIADRHADLSREQIKHNDEYAARSGSNCAESNAVCRSHIYVAESIANEIRSMGEESNPDFDPVEAAQVDARLIEEANDRIAALAIEAAEIEEFARDVSSRLSAKSLLAPYSARDAVAIEIADTLRARTADRSTT